MQPEMKPIRGYPGYFITRDGEVYSSRNSRDGSLKVRTTRADGTILLSRESGRRSFLVSKLVADAWGPTP